MNMTCKKCGESQWYTIRRPATVKVATVSKVEKVKYALLKGKFMRCCTLCTNWQIERDDSECQKDNA